MSGGRYFSGEVGEEVIGVDLDLGAAAYEQEGGGGGETVVLKSAGLKPVGRCLHTAVLVEVIESCLGCCLAEIVLWYMYMYSVHVRRKPLTRK